MKDGRQDDEATGRHRGQPPPQHVPTPLPGGHIRKHCLGKTTARRWACPRQRRWQHAGAETKAVADRQTGSGCRVPRPPRGGDDRRRRRGAWKRRQKIGAPAAGAHFSRRQIRHQRGPPAVASLASGKGEADGSNGKLSEVSKYVTHEGKEEILDSGVLEPPVLWMDIMLLMTILGCQFLRNQGSGI